MKGRKHILIVEDERHIGIGLKFNCDAEGYATTLVEDGHAALKLLETSAGSFDLVILDLMLPGMSGYRVLETIRQNKVTIPVLVLTARTLSEDKIRGFDCGADQYMTKPFELPELLSRVRALLARYEQIRGSSPQPTSEGTADDIAEFDGCTVNFSRHEVTVRGEGKTFTPLELKLLRHFLQNEGIVLTRSELLDRVWGFETSPATRTVDNFVLRLRQHIEVDPARPRHFLSVRGVGYRFVRHPTGTPTDTEIIDAEADSDGLPLGRENGDATVAE